MLERDPKTLARLQAVVTALIEHRVATSLVDVERALAKWRSGQHSALAAHGAVLRHAARCERTVERVTAAAGDRPEGILRDAVDAGLMDAAEFVSIVGKPVTDVESIGALVDEDDASGPDKQKTMEALLARGPVLVHIDARRTEVSVPARFRADASLVLRFGYRLEPKIVDLCVDDNGIAGTLSFGGQPFHCVLPWSAVYAAMVEGEQRGTVWPEDVPEDVLTNTDALTPAPSAGATDEDFKRMKSTAPAMTSVPPSPAGITTTTDDAGEAIEPRKRGGHLKLVD